MNGCTFAPDTKKSKKGADQPRDLYNFLSDQQRHLENKNMKILQGKQEQVNKEVGEVTRQPKLDDLSR
jgi:hypothetical protein